MKGYLVCTELEHQFGFELLLMHVLIQLVLDYWSSNPELRHEAQEFVLSPALHWLADALGMPADRLRHRIVAGRIDLAALKWARTRGRSST